MVVSPSYPILYLWIGMQTPELCVILNFNRCDTQRAIRRAVRSLRDQEEALIIDVIWRAPFKYRGREIPRKTIVELISFDDMRRIFKITAATIKKIVKSVPAPMIGQIPIAPEHFHSMISQSNIYHFFRDLDAHYLEIGNMILEKTSPSRVIVIVGDRNSQHIATLCHERHLHTTVQRQKSFRTFFPHPFYLLFW